MITTSTYTPQEASKFLADLELWSADIIGLGNRMDEGSRELNKPYFSLLGRVLHHIGSLGRSFSLEIKKDKSASTEILAYLTRATFETICLLSYLSTKDGPSLEIEVLKQAEKDRSDIFHAINPMATTQKAAKEMVKISQEYKAKSKTPGAKTSLWDAAETSKHDPFLKSEYEQKYRLFCKMAHPTAYSLFMKLAHPQDDRTLRSLFLSQTTKYLSCSLSTIEVWLRREGVEFEIIH